MTAHTHGPHSRYAPKPVYRDSEERQRTLEAVRLWPRREGEGVTAYLDRVAKAAGLMSEDGREPGEEG